MAQLPADLIQHIENVERDILVDALLAYRFNRTAAGHAMGLTLRQMRYRMERLGITRATLRELVGMKNVVTLSQLSVTPPNALTEKCHPIGGYRPS